MDMPCITEKQPDLLRQQKREGDTSKTTQGLKDRNNPEHLQRCTSLRQRWPQPVLTTSCVMLTCQSIAVLQQHVHPECCVECCLESLAAVQHLHACNMGLALVADLSHLVQHQHAKQVRALDPGQEEVEGHGYEFWVVLLHKVLYVIVVV